MNFTFYSILPKQLDHIDQLLSDLDKKAPGRQPSNPEAELLDEGLHDANLDADDDVNIQEIFR